MQNEKINFAWPYTKILQVIFLFGAKDSFVNTTLFVILYYTDFVFYW